MRGKWVAVLVIAIVAGAIVSGSVYFAFFHSTQSTSLNAFHVTDLSPDLGTQFTPGSIQAFGANSTSLLISGMGIYNKSTDFSLPNLMEMNSLSPNVQGKNMDYVADQYFKNGNVFGTGWNGSSWLLTGQISWGNVTEGAVISMTGTKMTNLTSIFSRYFQNGGIWFDGWNGTGWLLGGNNDRKASLVSYQNGIVVNETSLLGNQSFNAWIQWLDWNESAWLVGGHGVFGFLKGNSYTSMLEVSAFNSSGVYASYFNDGRWIVGGGPPVAIQVVVGNRITDTIHMPSFFNAWINGITFYEGQYLVGGKGLNKNGSMHPALYSVVLNSSSPSIRNLTSFLPSSFDLGQIQFISFLTFAGNSGVLIAGQGHYDPHSGFSKGALAFLTH